MTLNEAAQILGIPVTANADQVRKAFRALAKKWHPDAHPNDPHAAEMMKKINEAHAVFLKHLERGSSQNNNSGATSGSRTGTRPGSSSGPRPGTGPNTGRSGTSSSANTGNTSRQDEYDRIMGSIINDLWKRYNAALVEYEKCRVELGKAFDKKVLWQGKYEKQRAVYEKSPTNENYKKLIDVQLEANKAELDHRTAKYHMSIATMLKDSIYKQYKMTIADYEKERKKQGSR